MAPRLGFEPRLPVPETGVLPLDDLGISNILSFLRLEFNKSLAPEQSLFWGVSKNQNSLASFYWTNISRSPGLTNPLENLTDINDSVGLHTPLQAQ